MKKRNILLSVLLIFVLMLAGCSSKDAFEGKWKGTLDLTGQIEDGIIEAYPELEEYVNFADLTINIDITFEDGMMSMSVDQTSVAEFEDRFAEHMEEVEEGSLMVYLDTIGLSLEEAVAESGMTEEEYVSAMIQTLEMDKMKDSIVEIVNGSLEGFEKVNGPYTFNEETINVRYDELEYEAIEYAFEGNSLILTFRGEGFSLCISCEKES